VRQGVSGQRLYSTRIGDGRIPRQLENRRKMTCRNWYRTVDFVRPVSSEPRLRPKVLDGIRNRFIDARVNACFNEFEGVDK
jgi:hypothetical protein